MAKLELETLAGSFSDANATGKMKEIAGQIGETMEDAYSLMLELSNPALYEIGLKAALDTLLHSDLVKSCGIKCRIVTHGKYLEIDIDVRVALYQATRELLINAIKHSKAKKVEIHLNGTHEAAAVTVQDNGVGFDPSDVRPPGRQGGFGLFNIRESIGGLGGQFEIDSKPGQGTFAKVWVPLSQKDSLK